jgi:hypothetical protein
MAAWGCCAARGRVGVPGRAWPRGCPPRMAAWGCRAARGRGGARLAWPRGGAAPRVAAGVPASHGRVGVPGRVWPRGGAAPRVAAGGCRAAHGRVGVPGRVWPRGGAAPRTATHAGWRGQLHARGRANADVILGPRRLLRGCGVVLGPPPASEDAVSRCCPCGMDGVVPAGFCGDAVSPGWARVVCGDSERGMRAACTSERGLRRRLDAGHGSPGRTTPGCPPNPRGRSQKRHPKGGWRVKVFFQTPVPPWLHARFEM